jgi:hypothetical protein
MLDEQNLIVKEKGTWPGQFLEYAQTRSSLGQGTDLVVRIANPRSAGQGRVRQGRNT